MEPLCPYPTQLDLLAGSPAALAPAVLAPAALALAILARPPVDPISLALGSPLSVFQNPLLQLGRSIAEVTRSSLVPRHRPLHLAQSFPTQVLIAVHRRPDLMSRVRGLLGGLTEPGSRVSVCCPPPPV